MGIRLGEICQFQSGGTPSRKFPEYFNGDIPWVTTTALNGGTISFDDANELITLKAIEESAAKLVPAHSILVGTRVGVGKTAINLIPMSTSQDIISLTEIDEQKWYKEFICKLISSKQNYLVSKARGATIKGIKIETLADLEIPEISISEQHFIVSIFDKLNFLILSRKQQLAKLDELVKARFVEMFGDPITSKQKRKLSDIGTIYTGNTPSMKESSYYESDDIPFIKPGDLFESGVAMISGAEAFVSEKARNVARIIPPKSILVTCIGTIGKIGISTEECCCNQQINFIIPKSNVDTVYLAYCLTFFKKMLSDIANAPVVPIINKTQFSELMIPVFDFEQQKKFASFVEQVDKSKVAVQKALDEAQTLFDSLMQQYFG